MAEFTEAATLDGVSPFTLKGNEYSFSGSFLGYVSLFNGTPDDSYRFTLNLTGAPWTIATLRFSGFDIGVTITDADDGQERRIDYLRLGSADNVVDVSSTRIRFIQGNDAENNRITLGAGNTTAVELYNGNDSVTGGSGDIEAVSLGSGNDRFVAGTGTVTSLNMGGGNDTVVVDNGRVRFVELLEGDDTVTLTGAGRIETMRGFAGTKTVTLRDEATLATLNLSGGTHVVRIQDDARIYSLKLDNGTNRVTTGDGFLESFYSFESNTTLTIGAGGAGQIILDASADKTQTVTANGFASSLIVFGEARAIIAVNAGAANIETANGNDRVTVNGGDFIGRVATRGGDDTVTLGSFGAQVVNLGDGDDRVIVRALAPANAAVIQGAGGTDTADFARVGQAVFVNLSQIGTFQNIGRADGQTLGVPGVVGYFSLGGIENLIGTSRADALTGRETANRLEGGAGNDTLSGLAGEDVLLGGKGNDRLTGGDDADTFRFARADGTDTITDFAVGEDLIAIAGVTALAQIRFTDLGGGGGEGETGGAVRLVANGTTIIVEGVTLAEIRDADNFVF